MRSLLVFAVIFSSLGISRANAQSSPETPWFDIDHCSFCQNMSSQPGLLENMQCDTIKLDNGIVMVAMVPKEFMNAMERANEGMQATVKQLQMGKQLPLCGFCECFGNLIMRGAKLEKRKGQHSEVTMLTSNDPQLVKDIHAMADRSEKERQGLEEVIRQRQHAIGKE